MQPVTKHQHQAAKYTAAKLRPAADAIAAIDDQALGYNQEAIQKLNEFCDFLSLKMLEAGAVIAKAQNQYENRDQALINASASRYFNIDADIAVAKAKQSALITNYQAKTEELVKKRFTLEEISKIVDDPAEEVAALDAAITALKAEKQKIQKFLADAPLFDEGLLTGTRVFEVRETQAALKGMVVKP